MEAATTSLNLLDKYCGNFSAVSQLKEWIIMYPEQLCVCEENAQLYLKYNRNFLIKFGNSNITSWERGLKHSGFECTQTTHGNPLRLKIWRYKSSLVKKIPSGKFKRKPNVIFVKTPGPQLYKRMREQTSDDIEPVNVRDNKKKRDLETSKDPDINSSVRLIQTPMSAFEIVFEGDWSINERCELIQTLAMNTQFGSMFINL
jgi:hypothetical protein